MEPPKSENLLEDAFKQYCLNLANILKYTSTMMNKVENDPSCVDEYLRRSFVQKQIDAFWDYDRRYSKEYRLPIAIGVFSGLGSGMLVLLLGNLNLQMQLIALGIFGLVLTTILVGTHIIHKRKVRKAEEEIRSFMENELEGVIIKDYEEMIKYLKQIIQKIKG